MTQGKLSVLRMFVLGLLLVNIVLITLRLMQPDDEEGLLETVATFLRGS